MSTLLTDITQTSTGPIVGKIVELESGKYEMFQGIPYAQPPVGELRFKKPISHVPWTNVLECTSFGNACPNKFEEFDDEPKVGYSEDCLFLNVFTPCRKTEDIKHSVLLYIHGGGFGQHSSANYGDIGICENLCSRGITVVTINYRLAIFGFYGDESEEYKGNNGLWDMAMALEWTVENIQRFGGDPSRITLIGHSAGAVAVDLLCLSPITRDHISGAILMGGSADVLSLKSPDEIREKAEDIAIHLNWKRDIPLTPFLLSQPAELFSWGFDGLEGMKVGGAVHFSPSFDGEFFPRSIAELRKEQPKIPYIIGHTKQEGLLFAHRMFTPKTEKQFHLLLSSLVNGPKYSNPEKAQEHLSKVYKELQPDIQRRTIQLLGDFIFGVPVSRTIHTLIEYGHSVYVYSLEYCNSDSYPLLGEKFPFYAATHGSELRYCFRQGVTTRYIRTDDDRLVENVFAEFIHSFTSASNPTVVSLEWIPYTKTEAKRLRIKGKKMDIVEKLEEREELLKQWEKMTQEENHNTI